MYFAIVAISNTTNEELELFFVACWSHFYGVVDVS